jgi:hypothetical protein
MLEPEPVAAVVQKMLASLARPGNCLLLAPENVGRRFPLWLAGGRPCRAHAVVRLRLLQRQLAYRIDHRRMLGQEVLIGFAHALRAPCGKLFFRRHRTRRHHRRLLAL